MGAPGPLLVALAGAVLQGFLFAQPPNVTYSVDEEKCSLHVTWLRAKSCNSSTQNYRVGRRVNGHWDSDDECETKTSRTQPVPLGKKIDFGVKTFCKRDCDESDWTDNETFSVLQNGTAGTGARNIRCIWWNRTRMECSWLPGEAASPDTSYKLSCWYGIQKEVIQCRNVTRQGSDFQCSFDLKIQHATWISISVQGDSGNIQTVCLIVEEINRLVKPYPPYLSPPSKNGSEVLLQWNQSISLSNLKYEVEVNSSKSDNKIFKDILSTTFPVDPNVQHTFRVRVKTAVGNFSDWSNVVRLEGTTSTPSVFPIILIPLCVAVLLVIVLIYLQRIKLLIFPNIPDPGKILKQIFEEQNDNQPTHETVNNEETHSLMLVEPVGNEKQGN